MHGPNCQIDKPFFILKVLLRVPRFLKNIWTKSAEILGKDSQEISRSH